MKSTVTSDRFLKGLVVGFDVGTGSIGWAVRKGSDFRDVGVLICPEETNDLEGRRTLRRQRRTLRSRIYRRQWFARELAGLLGLELHKEGKDETGLPKSAWEKNAEGGWIPKPGFETLFNPVALRLRAVNGEELKAEELHAALTHLFKRRGYTKVPWANSAEASEDEKRPKKKDDDEGIILKAVEGIRKEMAEKGCPYPCELLTLRAKEQELWKEAARIGQPIAELWAAEKMKGHQAQQEPFQRKIYWPRELLEKEFRDILKAQAERFPKLAEKADWLLYGDTREVRGHRVYFKSTEARDPGVLGLRWPRFDNRGPALDALQPMDEQGRPLHVVRKNKETFTKTQWELALMNFRVLDAATRKKIDPRTHFPAFIENLHNEWNKKGKVTAARLKKLAAPFQDRFLLVDNQKPLTPETGAGRARYSSPTLEIIRKEISTGRRVDPPQPILRRKGESAEEALNRYLADIKHPLVRHRLVLFRRLLSQLVLCLGQPDMIVLEAVRSLALGQRAKNELNKRNEQFRKEREVARDQLSSNGESVSRKAVQRYRLWQEAKARCPFCLETIERTDLGHGADIEHLVPRSTVDCSEFYNLTVAHIKCNRELKGERTPFAAFSGTSQWPSIKDNAAKTFSGRKLEIFLSPNAEELIEQKADLQHTAYIARVIRHLALIQLGWLNDEGRDPSPEKQNSALRFQVTNGQLTSRLRKAWGLNQILHPFPPSKRWDELSEADQEQFTEKNRGDLRHHALDAMVIACTLPWLAHRTHGTTDEFGNHGWWTQDEKRRSKAANPLFSREGEIHKVCKEWMEKVAVRHHVSRSNHQQAYATTLYSKKDKDTYVVRKPFTSLTVKNLSRIYPKELAAYCAAAWEGYTKESADINAQLKKTDKRLPESFTKRLCFSHFQKWRVEPDPIFRWPAVVKIPIKSVRMVAIKDDRAVVPFGRGTRAYVERTGFKEVRIHLSANGKSFVPVFVPYWKRDSPFSSHSVTPNSKPVAVIRKGQVVELKKPLAAGAPAGKYRVLVMGQEQIKILPPHVANKDEAKIAFQLPKSGLQPYWPEFIRCLGYELPHSPSAQSQSPGADEA